MVLTRKRSVLSTIISMSFSGFTTSNYLYVMNPPIVRPPISVFAYGMRNSGTTAGNVMQLFDTVSPTINVNRLITVANTQELRVATVGDGITTTLTHFSSIPQDEWNVLGGVWATNQIRRAVTINDIIYEADGAVQNTPALIDQLRIGVSGQTSNPWNGKLAEVAFWNAELTRNDILDLNRGISPLFVRRDKLMSYYPLVDNFQDAVGIYHLTQVGTLTKSDHPNIFYEQNVSRVRDYTNRALEMTLYFSHAGATQTEWEFTINSSSFTLTTSDDGPTGYANVLDSGLRFVKMQLPIGHDVVLRVRQKVEDWKEWTNDITFTTPYFNSYDRFLELSGETESEVLDASIAYGSRINV